MTRKYQFSLAASTAMLTLMTAGLAVGQVRDDGGSSNTLDEPYYDANTSLGVTTGDNLGNHTATEALDMNFHPIINVAVPEEPQDAVNLSYLQQYVALNGPDNLGNHIATQHLNMQTFMVRVQAPQGPNDATNRAYVDSAIAGAGDDLGNHVATEDINANNHRVINLRDPASNRDAVNLQYLQDYVDDNGDHLGNHTATLDLNLSGFGITNLRNPVNGPDAANKTYVDTAITTITDGIRSVRIDTGTGLLGGGDLTANRTLTFDTAWGDARYALRNRQLIAGSGLAGGGNLSADRTISVDATVVRTSRHVATGTGLTGGGDLSANRTLAFDTTWGDNRYLDHTSAESISGAKTFTGVVNVANPTANPHAVNKGYVDAAVAAVDAARTYLAGNGLTLTGNTFAVNPSQVMMLSGNQTVTGTKTFSSAIAGSITGNAGTATLLQNARTINGVAFNGGANITLPTVNVSAGNSGDLDTFLTSQMFGWNSATANRPTESFGQGIAIVSQGTTHNNSSNWITQLGFGTDNNSAFFRGKTNSGAWGAWRTLVHSGNVADFISANETTYGAGDGLALTGSTFAVDGTVVRTAGNQTIAGVKTFSSTIAGSVSGNAGTATLLQTARTINGVAFNGGANITLPTVNLTGNQTVAGVKTFSSPVNVATPTAAAHATTKAYVDAAIVAGDTNTTYTAGTGLSLSGTTFAFNTTWGDARYAEHSNIDGSGQSYDDRMGGTNTADARTFYHSQGNAPTDAPLSAQFAGMRIGTPWGRTDLAFPNSSANRGFFRTGTSTNWAEIVSSENIANFVAANETTYTAGDGLALAGTTFAVDGTVVRTAGNQTIAGVKTFSSTIAGSVSGNAGTATLLQTARTINGVAFNGGANITLPTVNLTGNQTVAGVKTFSSPVNVATPTAAANATTKAYVDAAIVAGDTNTTYTAGQGLTLTGTVFALDTTWGDNRYALRSRQIISGTGLTGGGDLSTNRTLAVDSNQVMMLAGTQTITGDKTFNTSVSVGTPTAAQHATTKAYVDSAIVAGDTNTTYTAGQGLTLTGTVFALDTTWGDNRYALRSRQITAGTGLTGGGDLSANRTLSVNSSQVMMLAGAQTVSGAKTFSTAIGVGTPTAGGHAATKAYVDAAIIAGDTNTTYVAGSGMVLTGNSFAVDGTVVRTSGDQIISGNKSFSNDIRQVGGTRSTLSRFDGSTYYLLFSDTTTGSWNSLRPFQVAAATGFVTLAQTTVNGLLTANGGIDANDARIRSVASPVAATDAANKAYVDAQLLATPDADTTYAAGTGLTLAGQVFNFNTAWGDARYALASRSVLAGTGLTGGGNLTANRTLSVNATVFRNDAANAGNLSFALGSGTGMRFWNSDTYKIYMSSVGDTTWGSRLDGTSDHNMYFRMGGGTNRGFVFKNADTAVFQIDGAGHIRGAGGIVTTPGAMRADNGFRVGADQVITASGQLNAGSQTILNVATPTAGTHAANKAYVDATVAAGDTDTTYTAGAGLSLTGTTFAFNTTWGDARYALAARSITAGTGLTGGGNLTANRTLSVNSAQVMMLSGNQTVAGTKTFSSTIAGSVSGNAGTATLLQNARTINGVAFNGGANITLPTVNVSGGNTADLDTNLSSQMFSWNNTSANRPSATYGQGIAIVSQGTTHNNSSNWITQLGFGTDNNSAFFRGKTNSGAWGAWRTLIHSGNIASYVAANETTYTAGAGLSLTGTTFAFSTAWGDARYALASRSIVAGTGLTGGGNLTANRTLAVNSAQVMMLSGNQTVAGVKTFSSAIAGSVTGNAGTATVLQTARTINGVAFNGSANISINTLASKGMLAAETGRAVHGTGVYTFNANNQSLGGTTPNNYWSVLGFGRGVDGSAQIAANWTGGGNELYFRSLRDNTDDWWEWKEIVHSGNITSYVAANQTAYTAGAGLSLSGTTFSFSTAWGDARYALASRSVIAGTGLTGGGNLTANRTLAVNSAQVMMLTGNQTVAGIKTFSSLVSMGNGLSVSGGINANNAQITNLPTPTAGAHAANKAYVDAQVAAAGTTYTAGAGITITGASIAFNTTWGDARYALASRSIVAGSGLTGGGTLAANRTLSIDAAHTRRAGNSATAGVLAHAGGTKTSAQFYSGTANPTNTPRLNYDGALYATNFWATNYFYFSDRNLKTDIEKVEGSEGMGMVRALEPVSFAWKANDARALGLIAQDVEAVVPTAVTTNEAGLKAVDYVQLISPMLAAIQELDARVQALEAAVK